MGNWTALFAFISGLSVATERITEVIKGLPGISTWLAVDKTGTAEEFRKAIVQLLAIVVGSVVASQTYDVVASSLSLPSGRPTIYILCGALASGGSGLGNSALDIVRETNKQKQILTDKLKSS